MQNKFTYLTSTSLSKGKKTLWGVVLPLTLFLSACSLEPTPITDKERMNRANSDVNVIFAAQEQVTKPITLYEAMARAIEYNLDHKVKIYEKALASGQLDLSKFDMLPQLTSNAGYHNRNNFAGGTSRSLISGAQSLEKSTSQDRDRFTYSLSTSWNILDFGLSYYKAKQQGNFVLIAEEQRRKALQNIIQDVRFAYWKAASADELIGKIDGLKKKVERALKQSRSVESERVGSPLEALNYQRSLLETLRQLGELRRTLTFAKTELAALMNLRPGQDFQLADKIPEDLPKPLDVSVDELEKIALLHRPELREEDYRERIAKDEVIKAWIEMMPSLGARFSYNKDSNSFLAENEWTELAIESSYNLFKLLSGPVKADVARAQGELSHTKRLALTVAVITQLNVAYKRYNTTLEELKLANQIKRVDQKIHSTVRAQTEANAESEQLRIMAAANELLGRMRRDVAYADHQSALASLLFSLGVDPVDHIPQGVGVNALADNIMKKMNNWENLNFTQLVNKTYAANAVPEETVKTAAVEEKTAETTTLVADNKSTGPANDNITATPLPALADNKVKDETQYKILSFAELDAKLGGKVSKPTAATTTVTTTVTKEIVGEPTNKAAKLEAEPIKSNYEVHSFSEIDAKLSKTKLHKTPQKVTGSYGTQDTTKPVAEEETPKKPEEETSGKK